MPGLGDYHSSSLAWTGFSLLGPLSVQSWVTWWLVLWTTPASCGYYLTGDCQWAAQASRLWKTWNSVAPIHAPDFRAAWWPQINLGFFVQKDLILVAPVFFFTRYRNTYWSLRLLSFDFPNGWKRNSRIQDSKPSQTLLQSYNMTLVYPWLTMWYFLGTQKCPFISLVENLTPELINVVKGDSVPATRHKRTNKQAYKHREFSHKCSFYFQRVESLASDPSRHCDASGKVRPW